MILSFTAIDKQDKFRDFWCQLPELEVALDVLSTISLKGDTIIQAHIIDEGSRTELPPEAFDGQLFSDCMHQLEAEWEAILKKPVHPKKIVRPVPDNNWQIDLTRQRIKIYTDRIDQFALVVTRFEELRERAEKVTHNEVRRANLVNHYNSALNTYRNYIDRAKAGQQVAQKRLNQLEA